MADICRLCCSTKYVNHYIFDEENSVFLKISLYLPIKVAKNDRLPQKICDDCVYKIDEFYEFYNRSIEVQHRLRLLYATVAPIDATIDLTVVKENTYSPAIISSFYNNQSTQTESFPDLSGKVIASTSSKQIKLEPFSKPPSPIKIESITDFFNDPYGLDLPSDDSEDTLVIDLKRRPKRSRKDKDEVKTGDVKENKRVRKSKEKTKDWNNSTPKKLLNDKTQSSDKSKKVGLNKVKQEVLDVQGLSLVLGVLKKVKEEVNEADYHFCCVCFTRCDSRSDMLQHYKIHGNKLESIDNAPAAPPLPDVKPLQCTRCQKVLDASEWAAHWRRHWERDRRPYRCSLCEKTFRDHHQILKHGLTHNTGECGERRVPPKRFVCDLCPESFVYMRCLLAHRTRSHPESAARALSLRCGQCARQFAHLNSLRRHLRAHSGERNFLCSVCGKALSSREHLKFHLRIHTGYKPHICKTCGKGFVKKCNLTLHERVHSGEKPHVCAHCGKAFSQRSTLVIHERYHSGARPYTCGLCGRGFVAKGLLSMHLKTTCVDARELRPQRLEIAPGLEIITTPNA